MRRAFQSSVFLQRKMTALKSFYNLCICLPAGARGRDTDSTTGQEFGPGRSDSLYFVRSIMIS